MKMSDKQHRLYLRLWWAAADAQGWKHGDNARRHLVTQEALGYPKSSKELTNPEFDKVKASLKRLADIVDADSPEASERRRLLFRIGQLADAPYVARLCRDKFDAPTPDRLTTPQLEQLRNTLVERKAARNRKEVSSGNPF